MLQQDGWKYEARTFFALTPGRPVGGERQRTIAICIATPRPCCKAVVFFGRFRLSVGLRYNATVLASAFSRHKVSNTTLDAARPVRLHTPSPTGAATGRFRCAAGHLKLELDAQHAVAVGL